ncbi:ATP-binding protein [Candidatus Microgenomates bacterium]|nr:ATP-binding protein [Candidatus Microgenomates bacterium]
MKFIQRKIYSDLKNHLKKPEISLILGPRQAGKTTLMLKLADELKTNKTPNIYFNLDIIENKQYFKTQHVLLDRIEKTIAKKKAVVFIDEIQRLENAGLFLKGLYDLGTDFKFIVSGSGSLELKADIIEPMTGRKKVFYCLPLSFSEFAGYKLNVQFKQISENLDANPYETERLIKEYLTFGGYPRVVLAQTEKEKTSILQEIYQSYLEKDVQLLLKVEKETAFQALIKLLASQVGSLINKTELSSTLGLTQKTLDKYLYFLEKTFVIYLVRPFFTNVRKELRKSPKVYFSDLGFLRLSQGRVFGSLTTQEGHFFENACFLRLKELNSLEPIRFWRSTSGAEVDFIFFSVKEGITPFEIKSTVSKIGTLGKSLISFIKTYQPKKAYFYTKNTKGEIKKLNTKIYYLPYHFLPDQRLSF